MEFKKSFTDAGEKETKTVITLKCDDLKAWAETYLTAEEYDHALWYGMGLEFFKPKFAPLAKSDRASKAQALFGSDVIVTTDVPKGVSDSPKTKALARDITQASPELQAQIEELLRQAKAGK